MCSHSAAKSLGVSQSWLEEIGLRHILPGSSFLQSLHLHLKYRRCKASRLFQCLWASWTKHWVPHLHSCLACDDRVRLVCRASSLFKTSLRCMWCTSNHLLLCLLHNRRILSAQIYCSLGNHCRWQWVFPLTLLSLSSILYPFTFSRDQIIILSHPISFTSINLRI